MGFVLKVECHSGYKADERPLRFTFVPAHSERAAGERDAQEPFALPETAPAPPVSRTYEVKEILDQWYGVGYQCFKVRADDGNLYILRQRTSTPDGVWELVSFRQGRE